MANSIKVSAAKTVSHRSHLVPGKLRVTEHFFDVPKDYSKPETGTLRLFARSIRKHETPADPAAADEASKKQLPWIVYLQGGPGNPCRPPQQYAFSKTLLDKGYQVLFLDQRGTGLSTPVTASTLGLRGNDQQQADYLKLFRADNIVRDCEAIRQALLEEYPADRRTWSTIGQSFGGFCTITYLSLYPEGLRECFIFGGLMPLVESPDEVYRRLFRKIVERNEVYYDKYPEDVERVKSIVKYLQRYGDGTIRLPSEGRLTVRRFQHMGIALGFHGKVDAIHEIVLRAASEIEAFGHLTRLSLSALDSATSLDDTALYAILHEPIYCSGKPANWSAERILSEYPQLSSTLSPDSDPEQPFYFTGETIFPYQYTDSSELSKMSGAAHLIAEYKDWPPLFSTQQLSENKVPVYAAAYKDDMYVDYEYSLETAKAIKGCKVWTTNVMFHDALREKMDEVLRQLFALREDVID